MKKIIYMTHDISSHMLNSLNNDDIFTLDDSLFSHYYYIDILKKYNIKLNITTNYIQYNSIRNKFNGSYLTPKESSEYMHNYVNNIYDDFLNLEELQYIKETYPNIEIVAHSHWHEPTIINIDFKKKYLPNWKDTYFKKINNLCIFKYGSKLANIGYNYNLTKIKENEYIDFIKKDTELMLEWFNKWLNYIPTSYCFPWNQSNDKLIEILKSYGFNTFYGNERKELN